MKENEYNKACMFITDVKVVGDIVEFYNEAVSKTEPIMYGNLSTISESIIPDGNNEETGVDDEYVKNYINVKDLKEKMVKNLLNDDGDILYADETLTHVPNGYQEKLNSLRATVSNLEERLTILEIDKKDKKMSDNSLYGTGVNHNMEPSMSPYNHPQQLFNSNHAQMMGSPTGPTMCRTNEDYSTNGNFNPYRNRISERVVWSNERFLRLSREHQQRINTFTANPYKINAKRELENVAKETIYNTNSIIKYGIALTVIQLDKIDELLNCYECALREYDAI